MKQELIGCQSFHKVNCSISSEQKNRRPGSQKQFSVSNIEEVYGMLIATVFEADESELGRQDILAGWLLGPCTSSELSCTVSQWSISSFIHSFYLTVLWFARFRRLRKLLSRSVADLGKDSTLIPDLQTSELCVDLDKFKNESTDEIFDLKIIDFKKSLGQTCTIHKLLISLLAWLTWQKKGNMHRNGHRSYSKSTQSQHRSC